MARPLSRPRAPTWDPDCRDPRRVNGPCSDSRRLALPAPGVCPQSLAPPVSRDQIAVELTESASRAVREATWDELVWELVGFDD
jgi:hypothetical protein